MKTDDSTAVESRIIEAAKRVFVRKGYEATTMNDIASEVGISRTAMHYYFRTKEMMFEAIFAQLINAVVPNIDLIMNEDTNILEKMPRIVDLYITALSENLLFPLFVINEMNRDPEHLFHAVAKNFGQVQVLVRLRNQVLLEMEQGLLNRLPLEDVVSTFIGLFVFPVLLRKTLMALFLEGDEGAFLELLNRRRRLTCDVMRGLLQPVRDEQIS
ncbi:MAG: TetR/AcrR family transcriptional regulator [Tannerellaceae bacterium]|jgi:AcrR family transcriptional regulator|nr:TetR/AcrR family transcriptional regulator [Tannerellaceae bacterium]